MSCACAEPIWFFLTVKLLIYQGRFITILKKVNSIHLREITLRIRYPHPLLQLPIRKVAISSIKD